MDRTHDPPPQACCSCSRPWGGVTHPTTLSRQHGAPTMCPHRAIISRAGGWAFEHGEPSSHKLHTALRCMLWVCEVFGACTGRAGIPRMHNRNPETLVLGVLSRSYVKRVQAAGPPVWLCENAGQQSPSNGAAVGTRKGNLLLLGTYSHLPFTPHLTNGRTIAALRNANTPRRRTCSASRRTA